MAICRIPQNRSLYLKESNEIIELKRKTSQIKKIIDGYNNRLDTQKRKN